MDTLPLHIFQKKCFASNIHNDLVKSITIIDFESREACQDVKKVLEGLQMLLKNRISGMHIEMKNVQNWIISRPKMGENTTHLLDKLINVFNEDFNVEIAGQSNSSLDQQSIKILCLMYLVDLQECQENLKIVVRLVCQDEKMCEVVIWCLLAILEKFAGLEDLSESLPSWLPSTSLSISNVAICNNIIDMLYITAALYPYHFIKIPDMDTFEFWEMDSTKEFTTRMAESFENTFISSLINLLNSELVSENRELTRKICDFVDNMNIDDRILAEILSKLLDNIEASKVETMIFRMLQSVEKLLSVLSCYQYDYKSTRDKLIRITEKYKIEVNVFLSYNQGEILLILAKTPYLLDFELKFMHLDRILNEMNETSKMELALECLMELESTSNSYEPENIFEAVETILQSLADDDSDISLIADKVASCAEKYIRHFNSFARDHNAPELVSILMGSEFVLEFDLKIKYTSIAISKMTESSLIQLLTTCLQKLLGESRLKFEILSSFELLFKTLYQLDEFNLEEVLGNHKESIKIVMQKYPKQLGWLYSIFAPYPHMIKLKVPAENFCDVIQHFDKSSRLNGCLSFLEAGNPANQTDGLIRTTKKLLNELAMEDEKKFENFVEERLDSFKSILSKGNHPWLYVILSPYQKLFSFEFKVKYYEETLLYSDQKSLWTLLSHCIDQLSNCPPHFLPNQHFLDFTKLLFLTLTNSDDFDDIVAFVDFAESHHSKLNKILYECKDYDLKMTIFEKLACFPKLLTFCVKLKFLTDGILYIDQSSLLDLLHDCLIRYKAPEYNEIKWEIGRKVIELSEYIRNDDDQFYNVAKNYKEVMNELLRDNIRTPFVGVLCSLCSKYPGFVDYDIRYNYAMLGLIELNLIQLTTLLEEFLTHLEATQDNMNICQRFIVINDILGRLTFEPSTFVKQRLKDVAAQHRNLVNLILQYNCYIHLFNALVDDSNLVEFGIKINYINVLILKKDANFFWNMATQCLQQYEVQCNTDRLKLIEDAIVMLLTSVKHDYAKFLDFINQNKHHVNLLLRRTLSEDTHIFFIFVPFLNLMDIDVKAKYVTKFHLRMMENMKQNLLFEFIQHCQNFPTKEAVGMLLPAMEILFSTIKTIYTILKQLFLDFANKNIDLVNEVLSENDGVFCNGSIFEELLPVMDLLAAEVKAKYCWKLILITNKSAQYKMLSGCLNTLANSANDNTIQENFDAVKLLTNSLGYLTRKVEDRENKKSIAESNIASINQILLKWKPDETKFVYTIVAPFPRLMELKVKLRYIDLMLRQNENFVLDFLSECVTNVQLTNDPAYFQELTATMIRICKRLTENDNSKIGNKKMMAFIEQHKGYINFILKGQTGMETFFFPLFAPYLGNLELNVFETKLKFLQMFLATENREAHWEFLSECLDRHLRQRFSVNGSTMLPTISEVFQKITSTEFSFDAVYHRQFANDYKDILNKFLSDGTLTFVHSVVKMFSNFHQLMTFDNRLKYFDSILAKFDDESAMDMMVECLEALKNEPLRYPVATISHAFKSSLIFVSTCGNDNEARLDRIIKTYGRQLQEILDSIDYTGCAVLMKIVMQLEPTLVGFEGRVSWLRQQLKELSANNQISISVGREDIFMDSYLATSHLFAGQWRNRFKITFKNENGVDGGGLMREWFTILTREIFNPNYALFMPAPGDPNSYMINKASHVNPEHHLDYFKFIGRFIGKSIFDNQYVDCHFTKAFYKHILDIPVVFEDFESEDPIFFNSLKTLLNNPISELGLDLTFSTDIEEFGVVSEKELKENGRNIEVTDENKQEYVELVYHMKMTGSVRQQLDHFKSGFYDVIPKHLISLFNEKELELLICGQPDIDIDDLMANTKYTGYLSSDRQIEWLWKILRSFDKSERSKFLHFATGSSKAPILGFSASNDSGRAPLLITKSHFDKKRLPTAHTCFNQIDLPEYDTYENMLKAIQTAIREGFEGYSFS